MVHTNRNLKILTGVLAALLVFSIAGNFYFWDKNQDLAKEKETMEKKANSLLLGQSRDIDNLNSQIAKAEKENELLTQRVTELNNSLNRKYTEFSKMDARYTSQLHKLQDSMQTQLSTWENQATQLTNERTSFVNRNEKLADEVSSLYDKLQETVPRNILTVDGFRVEAEKRNNKETAKAKKVHTLTVSFNIPPQLGFIGTREVYLSLTDPQGTAMMAPLHTVTVTTPETEKLVPVHAQKKIDFGENSQRIVFSVEESSNIRPGVYRASVYTKDNYIGSVEFQFRDSFLFF